MDWIVAACLAILQGLTEFLPISSSAHLILPAQLLGIKDQGLTFDIALHCGSLVAVIHYFRAKLATLSRGCLTALGTGRQNGDSRLSLQLLLASLPVVAVGFFIQGFALQSLRTVTVIALTTLIFGILLLLADRKPARFAESQLSFVQAFFIGCAQALALVPGVSRSGIVLTAGRWLGLDREAATRFSFLLGIPAIAGASLIKLTELSQIGTDADIIVAALGFTVSLVTSWLGIHFFLGFVGRIGLLPFALYRIALGILLLLFFV